MELQDAWRNLERSGVAVFALSYDSVETLAAFAEKRGITYPILSDLGSQKIRALGLLNEKHLVEQHAFYGIQTRDDQLGVAYPGTFVLNDRGIISQKHFEQSYRVWPTARMFKEWALGYSQAGPGADSLHSTRSDIEVRAWTDALTYRPYQQVRLHVELSLPPGMHVFASPARDGYVPLSLHVEPLDELTIGSPGLPAAKTLNIEGLDETFLVYEGSIRVVIPLQFTKNLGSTMIILRLAYQACTPAECFPPATLRVDVPLNGLDLIRD